MHRTGIWTLEVSDWTLAAEAGVRPIRVYAIPYSPDVNPAHYRPYAFHFDEPPSRQDFKDMCNDMPWTAAAFKDLFPIIAKNPWVMVEGTCKAGSVELKNDKGIVVGSLEVVRDYLRKAEGYARVDILDEVHITPIIKRLPPVLRAQGTNLIRAKRHEILESFKGQWVEDEEIWQAIKRVLYEGGLRKSP